MQLNPGGGQADEQNGCCTQLVLADGSDSAIQFQSRQRQVVGLTTGILPHLFDPDMSPALLFLFGWIQRPRGRRPEPKKKMQDLLSHICCQVTAPDEPAGLL